MYSVNYHRAASVADAVKLLESGDAKLLSGGMTLIPAMKTRLAAPSDLVDLSHIAELKGIEVAGSSITIRAATTHHDVASDEKLRKACPALAHMASRIGDPAVRYKGTIGGSIANNDPAADYPAALLALDATIVTNKREIAADAFFTGLFETALEDGEIITAVTFTAPAKAAYEKFRNPASRYAIVGVFVANGADGVRVAVTGAGDSGVFRSKEIEAALATNFDAAALNGVKVPANDLMSDIHASADYRANLIVVMAKRAVAAANA
ncbi:xanthine dehydrogenase family protein subunit M [Mesorhizobium sp.]|uniref:FAD binding domain-containing protein n=1 Tax=Mesorhizobium sp. TaxID=1871066 RepID=UPI000FE829FB|nr:xanthine dehydrogenase family protein subunit M [Mesorhizobium sp.]RWK43044.1 MAG: xanthine dehydrogenase family protein subunit M [Mesorhizobium sp.]RWK68168.1 MAG: xanthine dehydrogenase family protein subunit M [Mesorhizobium sp.]RWK76221.1 MAG: xanthine dehydrogenase family protein subunit M [Mesorhizobium sp.]RWK81066.1 MAG: xanthine dehydrogenase family protein subunit M [Mesorhizobium sp.]RWL08387.1 MAG: xanthine dehydrogenase family protein subunit M [Mesorhizobium sp.]